MVLKHVTTKESLQFIDTKNNQKQNTWAANIPTYEKSLDAQSALLNTLEKELIPKQTALIFKEKIHQWQGEEMPLGRSWLNTIIEKLPKSEEPIATLIFLTAFAPYSIQKQDILNFKKIKSSDQELLETCYWSAQVITNQIALWLLRPFNN